MNSYFALVHKEADSAYGISFPDLPGCFSAADDEDRIFQEAQTALTLYASDEEVLPVARLISQLRADVGVKAEIEAGAFLISVPLIVVTKKERYNLMLASDLVEGVDATAETLGVSRSEFVSDAIGQRLARQVGAVVMRRSSTGGFEPYSKTASKAEKSVAASAMTQKGRKETTSAKVAKTASMVMRDPKASKAAKSVAASALTQKGSKETTSARVAASASKVMRDPKASKAAKSAAASALTQKVKKKA